LHYIINYLYHFQSRYYGSAIPVASFEDIMEQEVWKAIQGYEGLYEVSNYGRFKSLLRVSYRNKDIIMKQTVHDSGYLIIGLNFGKKQKVFRTHRIVASHFCEKKDGCDIVNHVNGIKTDNRASNLEWTTNSGNMIHAFAMGLHKTKVGKESNFAILKESDVISIRNKYKEGSFTQKQLGEIFNVSRPCISLIVNNKNWKHI